jgi:hypothetical protein
MRLPPPMAEICTTRTKDSLEVKGFQPRIHARELAIFNALAIDSETGIDGHHFDEFESEESDCFCVYCLYVMIPTRYDYYCMTLWYSVTFFFFFYLYRVYCTYLGTSYDVQYITTVRTVLQCGVILECGVLSRGTGGF